jgi:TetR/AcrR family transcriptional regulator, transcriptional repressor for nem operon
MRRRSATTSRPPTASRPAARRPAAEPAGEVPSGQDTRPRILRAAFQLFHEQGYHATGVATILREAGVNPGSLYHFFPSKEALLVAVLEFALVLLRPAVMDPAERRTNDPVERVFELLQQYREGMHAWGCKMGCPIGNLALEVADDNAPARQLIHQNFENWALAVRKWLDDAGDRLPSDLDRTQLARFVLTVLEGGLMQARAAGDLRPFDDSVAQLRSYFGALQQVAATAPTAAAGHPAPAKPKRQAGGRSARHRTK